MITDLHDHQLEATYDRFVNLLGGKPWLKATQSHLQQFAANPLSELQVTRENRAAYGLTYFDEHGMALQGTELWPVVLHGLTFAAQVYDLAQNGIDEETKSSYIARVRGAFANADDMRALRFEHLTALGLHKQEAQIHWPDDSTGTETYDLLVTTKEGIELEVECKSISSDKGRPITERDSTEFFNRLIRKLPTSHKSGELLLLKLLLPGRLPKSHSDLDQLVSEIVAAITAGASTTNHGVGLRQQTIAAPFLRGQKASDYIVFTVNELVDRTIGMREGHRAIFHSERSETAVCFEVTSEKEARVLKAMWETTKHAVQDQMTGTRPGCLVMKLEGLTRDELIRLSSESTNPLAYFATKVLTDPRHQHLACIAFVSDSELVSLSESTHSEQSVSYVFDQQVGPYAYLGFGRLLRGHIVE